MTISPIFLNISVSRNDQIDLSTYGMPHIFFNFLFNFGYIVILHSSFPKNICKIFLAVLTNICCILLKHLLKISLNCFKILVERPLYYPQTYLKFLSYCLRSFLKISFQFSVYFSRSIHKFPLDFYQFSSKCSSNFGQLSYFSQIVLIVKSTFS